MLGLALAAFPAACKRDCGETARLGDFEFSQGNYANAVKRYEQALREDPKCYNVEGKLAEARRKAAAER
jgi:cytochrome c-type biogenesis protein CcmH/NrfG